MRENQKLGLDELMIVNPSSSGTEAMLLGEDGTLYQVQGLREESAVEGLGQCGLGEDGRELGRYFLGDDGVLYEVVR